MKKIFCYIIILGLAACSGVTIDPEPVTDVYRIAAEWPQTGSLQRDSILRADRAVLDPFMQIAAGCEASDSTLDAWARGAVVRMFTPAVDSVFPTTVPVGTSLGEILANAADKSLDLPRRRYAAVVWGRPESIVFADSVMLIALNHYLGADFAGYAPWPDYRRREKTPERLPYDMAEALVATRYPFTPDDNTTVLSHILYDGALTHAKIQLIPQGSLGAALGCTDSQLQWMHDHRHEMWRTMVGKKLVYSTSADVAERLTRPAPATPMLAPDAPGRAGSYLGYCFVIDYLESYPSTSIEFLLSPAFYNDPAVMTKLQ